MVPQTIVKLESKQRPLIQSTVWAKVVWGLYQGTQSYPDRRLPSKKLLRVEHTINYSYMKAQITGQLEHPNIVPVHQICMNDQNELMVVMKKVHGQTLDARLKELKTNPSMIRSQ